MESPSVKKKRNHRRKIKSDKKGFSDLCEVYNKLMNSDKNWKLGDMKEFPELKVNRMESYREKDKFLELWGDSDNNFDKEFPSLPKAKGWKNDTKDPESNKTQSNTSVLCKNENQKVSQSLSEKKKTNPPDPGKPKKNPKKKKRSDPIFIDLNKILEVKKKKENKSQKIVKTKHHRFRDKKETLSGNPLDSSKPKRNRGKHREIKKKKLSNLKIVIIKERIMKQKLKENSGQELDDLIKGIDFAAEIKKYLLELKEKKVKKTEKPIDAKEENKNEDLPEEKKNLVEAKESCLTEVKFSSKLREYCDNVITPSLNLCVSELIKAVVSLQDKMFARDPLKAQAKRRHVSGFKEVKKYLILKKVKMIVMAPNLEKMQMKGSIYDIIMELKAMASSQDVPYVFALNRYKLGRCTKKNVPVSAFAILNYEGANILFEKVLEEVEEAKKQFLELTKPKEEPTDVNSQVLSSFISNFKNVLNVSNDNSNG